MATGADSAADARRVQPRADKTRVLRVILMIVRDVIGCCCCAIVAVVIVG